MNKTIHIKTSQLKLEHSLYPESQVYDDGYLQVSDIHQIYYAQLGNPNGVPALYLHGGPMAGNSPASSQYFDPTYYRIIIFDQRGAGKSKPHASIEQNTTQDLIKDIVKLKEHLGVDTWLVTGGSWGSALAMAYGEAYPEHARGFILRGVFDGSKDAYMHLLHDMGKTCPIAYNDFKSYLPKLEQHNILESYHARLTSQDPNIHMPAANAFVKYDTICGMLTPNISDVKNALEDQAFVLSISRGFFHYANNAFFMDEKEILNNLHKIAHLPCNIVHGQHDAICPAQNAYEVFKKWPGASLMYVQDAGHFASQPGIALGLVAASDSMKLKLSDSSA